MVTTWPAEKSARLRRQTGDSSKPSMGVFLSSPRRSNLQTQRYVSMTAAASSCALDKAAGRRLPRIAHRRGPGVGFAADREFAVELGAQREAVGEAQFGGSRSKAGIVAGAWA